MKNKNRLLIVSLCAAFLFLIFDNKTAVDGAKEAITLCLNVVIPSLFPFLFLSAIISSLPIESARLSLRALGVPSGGETIFILGLLGGYPVGAQSIYDAYVQKRISLNTARRLLGFCNNAGPSFIFGMLSQMFTTPAASWYLWGIHIVSAILTGVLLPGKVAENCSLSNKHSISMPAALNKALRSMSLICGWVILFRICFSFLQKWLLHKLPSLISVSIIGLCELTNGCVALHSISSEPLRFILCSVILAFGGLCVGMQTASVTKELGTGMYFPGKVLQALFSFLLSCVCAMWIFP